MNRVAGRVLLAALAWLVMLSPLARAQEPVTHYLPLVLRPATADYSVDGLEVTQSVQDERNSVPLVAGRNTVVRVYARASGLAPAGVTVSLSGTRGGSPLPGSPLTAGPLTVSAAPSRGVYTSSVNFALPGSWLAEGALALAATVDSLGAVGEADEANNTAIATVTFSGVPGLSLKVVPVRYTHTPTGQVYPAPRADTISGWIRRAYPLSQVSITFRPAIDFGGDLKNSTESWYDLLDQVTSLKGADGAPASQVYYGFVSTTNGTVDWLGNSGIVGIGWIGSRAAAGLDLPAGRWGADAAGQTAAHEIGHNLGRYHAPCGNPAGVDTAYPYAGASIGQYGLDIATGTIWNPNPHDQTANPYGALDLMSYCHPQWLSDYTYRALYDDQRLHGTQASSRRGHGLLIRASVGGGAIELKPVYALSGVPLDDQAAGGYRVELLDRGGAIVASSRVAAYAVETPHPVGSAGSGRLGPPAAPRRMIHAVVARPSRPVARLRLMQGEKVLVERALPEAGGAPGARLVTAPGRRPALVWGTPDVPALVRCTADGGATWQTLALDAQGGELALDLVALPKGPVRFEIALADRSAPVATVDLPGH